MNFRIIVGNEPYLINKYIDEQTSGYTVNRVDSFSSNEVILLRQLSIFGNNAVVIENDLPKEQEKDLVDMIKANVDIPGILFYVPRKVDKKRRVFKLTDNIVSIKKPEVLEVFETLIEACQTNDVAYKVENLQYLLDYSEYLEEDSISLYDLIGVIRSTSGNEITKEHINISVQRSTKDNAFELINLIPKREELIEYMNRLSSNPYQIIGALSYAFRIMAKLKLSQNIGISDYQKRIYSPLAERWDYKQIVAKLKMLNSLKEIHETKDVARALILATLLE